MQSVAYFLKRVDEELKKIGNTVNDIYISSLFAKLFAGWGLLTFLISFNTYFSSGYLSSYSGLPCFPHFQNCKALLSNLHLQPLPLSYGESTFFTILLGLIVLAAYLLYSKKYTYVHLIIGILLSVKILILCFNYGLGNYDYYDIVLLTVFFFYPSRQDLAKLVFVILYFLASTIKIHEGWIVGTYFSSLYYGLPSVPDAFTPIATNIVIIMQLAGCWFLLSKHKKIANYVLYFFIFFHLYSTVLVAYRYPITSLLSMLVIFVATRDTSTKPDYKINKRNAAFYFLMSIILVGQSVAYIIPGDQKLTLEGNNYGLYMFEANHQCVSTVTVKGVPTQEFSYDARNRCDPYGYLYTLQYRYCKKEAFPISWTFDHSINGKPFLRIIDSNDLCALRYKPFTHNSWIKLEEEAPVVGMPYKNIYLSRYGIDSTVTREGNYMYPPTLASSGPTSLTPLQLFITKHLNMFTIFYWTIWFMLLCYGLYKILPSKNETVEKPL